MKKASKREELSQLELELVEALSIGPPSYKISDFSNPLTYIEQLLRELQALIQQLKFSLTCEEYYEDLNSFDILLFQLWKNSRDDKLFKPDEQLSVIGRSMARLSPYESLKYYLHDTYVTIPNEKTTYFLNRVKKVRALSRNVYQDIHFVREKSKEFREKIQLAVDGLNSNDLAKVATQVSLYGIDNGEKVDFSYIENLPMTFKVAKRVLFLVDYISPLMTGVEFELLFFLSEIEGKSTQKAENVRSPMVLKGDAHTLAGNEENRKLPNSLELQEDRGLINKSGVSQKSLALYYHLAQESEYLPNFPEGKKEQSYRDVCEQYGLSWKSFQQTYNQLRKTSERKLPSNRDALTKAIKMLQHKGFDKAVAKGKDILNLGNPLT